MRLIDYLKYSKISQTQFARLINVSRMHVSNICRGKRIPSLPLTRRIIEVTKGQVTVGDLLHSKDKENDN